MSARREARRTADPARAVDPSTVPSAELVTYRASYWRAKVRDRTPPDGWAFGAAMWCEIRARALWEQATARYLTSIGRDPRERQEWRREVATRDQASHE